MRHGLVALVGVCLMGCSHVNTKIVVQPTDDHKRLTYRVEVSIP
jgi:hypothetical protein